MRRPIFAIAARAQSAASAAMSFERRCFVTAGVFGELPPAAGSGAASSRPRGEYFCGANTYRSARTSSSARDAVNSTQIDGQRYLRRRTCAADPPSGVEQSAEAARSVASAIAQQPAPTRGSQLFGMVDGDQTDNEGTQYAFGADYKLAKNSKVYAYFNELTYEDGTTGDEEEERTLGVGMEHKF